MDFIKALFDQIFHLDRTLGDIITRFGTVTYVILFAVIFAETGLVIMPFLPGDSLLFAAGALAASTGALNPVVLFIVLSVAAIVGDTVNYWVGSKLGERAAKGEIKYIKKEYIERTHAFFEKHGGKTIFLARFVPIVRTFAPFVAGASKMSYRYFFSYNVFGGLVWVGLFVFMGYGLSNVCFPQPLGCVKDHFEAVIGLILVVSILPIIFEWLKARAEAKKAKTTNQTSDLSKGNVNGSVVVGDENQTKNNK